MYFPQKNILGDWNLNLNFMHPILFQGLKIDISKYKVMEKR